MINGATPIKDVPREWLRYVEPYIERNLGPCWIWVGALDRQGYPKISIAKDLVTGKASTVMVHRYVAGMFWDFPKKYYVTQSCGVRNCVNPNHLIISKWHYRQKNS